jgi:hypothetical protein
MKTLIEQATFFGGIILVGLVMGYYDKFPGLFETEAQRKAHKEGTAEQIAEIQTIVAEQQRFRRAAARKYFGNGNPEHLDLLADTLTEEQLDLYRRYINRK